jgi:hypothetical protein
LASSLSSWSVPPDPDPILSQITLSVTRPYSDSFFPLPLEQYSSSSLYYWNDFWRRQQN